MRFKVGDLIEDCDGVGYQVVDIRKLKLGGLDPINNRPYYMLKILESETIQDYYGVDIDSVCEPMSRLSALVKYGIQL